jgi:hypothetical protein
MENAKLRSELDDLKLKVDNSDATGPVIQTPAIISHILHETFERERCASNAIIYGSVSQLLLPAEPQQEIERFVEPQYFFYNINTDICFVYLNEWFTGHFRHKSH